mgnify:CR=1 FL=1
MDNVVEIIKETTVGFQPHTYYLNKEGKCVAYKKFDESVIQTFKKPLSFSKSYRKFEKVKVDDNA